MSTAHRSARFALFSAGAALLGVACVACAGAPPAATPSPAAAEASQPTSAPKHDGGVVNVQEQHKSFLTSCMSAAASSRDYCDCAWAEMRKVLSDDELTVDQKKTENPKIREKLERVQSKINAACISLTEEAAQKDFSVGCVGDKPEMRGYCDCFWAESRKKFSAQDLARADIVNDTNFVAARAGIVKVCASKIPENVPRDPAAR